MTAEQFRSRMYNLGCETSGEAARILKLDRTQVHRLWRGERAVSPRTERLIELVELAQPAQGLTCPIRRTLLTAARPNARVRVRKRRPRSAIDRIVWANVYLDMEAMGLIRPTEGGYHVLTALGARCARFLRAQMET